MISIPSVLTRGSSISALKFPPFSFLDNNKKRRSIEEVAVTPGSSTTRMSLDNFDVLRLLGKGATSRVFLVRCKRSEALYALKVVPKTRSSISNLPHEEKALRCIAEDGCPFLILLAGSWEDTANFYLLTSWCQGTDMAAQILREGRFSKDRARLYLAQLILALENLHARRVLHRDVKPANIFFDAKGSAVLGDLGLARHFPVGIDADEPDYVSFEADPDATSGSFHWEGCSTTERCGTPAFMSPDQHQGAPYSFDTDVWSLGVTFFYMLTGRSPFPGNPRSPTEYARVAMGTSVGFKDEDDLDEEVRDVILWLVAKNSRDRATLDEIKEHTFFSCIAWDELASGTSSGPYKPYMPPVPRTARPELILAGEPYEQGSGPSRVLCFVRPDLVDEEPKPLSRPSFIQVWLGQLKTLNKAPLMKPPVAVNPQPAEELVNVPTSRLQALSARLMERLTRKLKIVLPRASNVKFGASKILESPPSDQVSSTKTLSALSAKEKVASCPLLVTTNSESTANAREKRLSHIRSKPVLDGQRCPDFLPRRQQYWAKRVQRWLVKAFRNMC
ncbi:kinase-like domain-containing protein [Mycena belliarum]|uniref:Kinase-like domain-containing protein n=1 Tax=Mycena belliarum TaxID=1033014 RepID=A0AAD6U069_9AGAR|nr:kinase-like domain-containing protein [Mycena belliae]